MKTFIATLALASALGGFSAPSHADRLDDVAKHLSEFTGYELERHEDEYFIHVTQNHHLILWFPRGMVGPRSILVVRACFELTNERSQSLEAINAYNAEMVFLKAYLDKDYGFIFERVELAGDEVDFVGGERARAGGFNCPGHALGVDDERGSRARCFHPPAGKSQDRPHRNSEPCALLDEFSQPVRFVQHLIQAVLVLAPRPDEFLAVVGDHVVLPSFTRPAFATRLHFDHRDGAAHQPLPDQPQDGHRLRHSGRGEQGRAQEGNRLPAHQEVEGTGARYGSGQQRHTKKVKRLQ